MLKIKTRLTKSVYGLSRFFDPIEDISLEDVIDDSRTIKTKVVDGVTFESVLAPETLSLVHNFTKIDDTVNYKLIVLNNENIVCNFIIDLDIIKSRGDFSDQTLWAIKDSVFEEHINRADKTSSYTLKASDLISTYVETFATKAPNTGTPNWDGNKSPIKLFIPSKNSNIDDVHFIVIYDDLEPEVFNNFPIEVTSTGDVDVASIANVNDLISGITITPSKSTLDEDDFVTLTLTAEDTSITEIFAEAVFGMVTKTRIPLNNGVGTVKVSSLGLSSGDPVRIKFGYKYYTGVAEYTNTIA
jgi:hypothetical protein